MRLTVGSNKWYGIRKESQESVGKLYKGNFCIYGDLIRNN